MAQAVVCVISTLITEEWEFVQIEPDTELDQVDIAWYYPNKQPRVVQVKTSKNNFTMSNIRKWTLSLINDYHEADFYELFLIGTCNDETKQIINRINEKKATDKDFGENATLISKKRNITITQRLNDQEALEAIIYRNLGKFLSRSGKHANDTDLELMSKSLIYTYMLYSTQGKKEERIDFENRLLSWIEHFLGIRTEKIVTLVFNFT